ncbi:hypothetical protein IW150_004743 [Coemansia sp. RSA 2607]|nr:hypothetical protein IW150_004743 [Coemansia sp. RSA 2607]
MSSLFLFIDTFVYSLTVANLPDILQTKMHISSSNNGLISSMFGIGVIIGSLVSAFLSDHFRVRRLVQLLAGVVYTIAGIVFFEADHYYQMLIFKVINGIASGVACTMLYTTVGDVFSANLLGFIVAIIYLCNNISYSIGPICGQKLYELNGVKGIASLVIALGLLEIVLLLTIVEDSLVQKESVPHSHELAIRSGTLPELNEGGSQSSQSLSKIPTDSLSVKDSNGYAKDNGESIPIWKLLLQPPVVVSAIAIITFIGIQCTLEGLIPLHLKDKLHHSDDSGVTFVAFGVATIVSVPFVGKINDWMIKRYGESVRYILIAVGSVFLFLFTLLMALAQRYAVMMVGYVLLAFAISCVFVPAQSAFGDFINYMGSDSMAQSFAISNMSWAIGAIALPPIGTGLYSSAGFGNTMIGISAIASFICIVACVAILIYNRKADHKSNNPGVSLH